MPKYTLLLSVLFFAFISCTSDEMFSSPTPASPPRKTIHQILWENHKLYPADNIKRWTAPSAAKKSIRGIVPGINGVVFGYYPYWMGNAYSYLDWSLLTHVAYFSADLNTSGDFDNVHGWPDGSPASDLRAAAIANGSKVLISVVAFYTSIHDAILLNTTVQQNAITNIIDLVASGNADGVNIDFENVSSGNKDYFTSFISNLSAQLKACRPGSLVSIAVPAVDWSGAFDLAALEPATDFFFIMGYDYHWASGNPGAVSPLSGGTINFTKSVQYYKNGCSDASKVIAGVPYYGIRWPCDSGLKGASQTANGTAIIISNTINYNYTWDEESATPWISWQSGSQWYQLWFENWRSIEKKIQLIKSEGIGGLGIWALGYDSPGQDIWTVINKYYNDDYSAPQGSIDNPYIVTTFPYTNSSTTEGKEKAFDNYNTAWTINETGPDEIYKIIVPANGTLSATVSDGSGVDVDLQLLSGLTPDDCVIRHDSSISRLVTAGIWYITADTYRYNSYAGDYTISIDFTPGDGTHASPYLVTSFPFSTNSSTSNKESLFSNYEPLSSTVEAGPEEVYLLQTTNYGRLTATVTDGIGIDIDVHLLTNSNASSCVVRNDTNIIYDIFPGEYYLIADTWTDNSYAGDYSLTISIAPPLLYNDFETVSLGVWSPSSMYWAHHYTGSVTIGSGAVRLRNNSSIQTTVDTTGKTSISWYFSMAAVSLESGEKVTAEYNCSGTWVEAASISSIGTVGRFNHYRIDLPAEAENIANLKLRFRLAGDAMDYGFIDRIMLCAD